MVVLVYRKEWYVCKLKEIELGLIIRSICGFFILKGIYCFCLVLDIGVGFGNIDIKSISFFFLVCL